MVIWLQFIYIPPFNALKFGPIFSAASVLNWSCVKKDDCIFQIYFIFLLQFVLVTMIEEFYCVVTIL